MAIGSITRGFPQRLRRPDGGATGAGRRFVDQHAAAAVGGERNERHESVGQWRAESFRTRWLVGRSIFAGSWVGDWRRARAQRRSALGCEGSGESLWGAGEGSCPGILQSG